MRPAGGGGICSCLLAAAVSGISSRWCVSSCCVVYRSPASHVGPAMCTLSQGTFSSFFSSGSVATFSGTDSCHPHTSGKPPLLQVVATPYATSFDHVAVADGVYFKFQRCLKTLGPTAITLPQFASGHSFGSLIHLLIFSRYVVGRVSTTGCELPLCCGWGCFCCLMKFISSWRSVCDVLCCFSSAASFQLITSSMAWNCSFAPLRCSFLSPGLVSLSRAA